MFIFDYGLHREKNLKKKISRVDAENKCIIGVPEREKWFSPSLFLLCLYLSLLWRRQWHPTPVLLPGKSMDGGAWWAAVPGVAKSQTRLSDFTFTFLFHALEKEMATHSSILAWRIPGTEEPSGLPSMGSHRVGHD